MPSYIPKQPKRERDQISIKLDRDVLRKLEQYGHFLESSRDYIINAELELVFRKDKSFSAWLKAAEASGAAEGSSSAADPTVKDAARRSPKRQERSAGPDETLGSPKAMRTLIENRTLLSVALSCSIGIVLYRRFPFPDEHPLLELVLMHEPYIFWAIRYAYVAMLFSTPLIGVSLLFSLLYIFVVRQQQSGAGNRLPPYPDPQCRESLFLVIGELHNPKRPEPAERPRWLTIPDRGLYTGIAVFGAIDSGKTSCCMYPFAEQIFAYKAADTERRASALVLEVKGDFCYKVAALLKELGCEADYVEVGLEGRYRYNPLHNDLEAYALAYGIASLLNNLFGKGKEPFWQQAYTNLVKFIILLHKVNYDYVTLFDVYECAINPELLESQIREGERLFETEEYVLISETDYVSRRDLAEFPFEKDVPTNEMKAPVSADLLRHLNTNRIPYSLLAATDSDVGAGHDTVLSRKREQLTAVKRWFYHDWQRID